MKCQCKGAIVNAEAWKLGRWDWSWLTGAFAHGIRMMDVDFLVERNGQFLVYETKGVGVDIQDKKLKGQRLALEALARLPQFTLAAIEGRPDEPEYIQECVNGIWRPRYETSNASIWNYTADWFVEVNRRRTA